MKLLLILIPVCFILSSCLNEVVWESGPAETRRVPLEAFSRLECNSVLDVRLVQDTLEYALITSGKNLIDRVTVSLEDSMVSLSEETDMNWTRSYRRTLIELHVRELRTITLNNCVNLRSLNTITSRSIRIWDNSDVSELDLKTRCDHFSLIVSGLSSGTYKVSGQTGRSYLQPAGSAHFFLENLETDYCRVDHKSTGDCSVNVKKVLEGSIAEKGRILYKCYLSLSLLVRNINGKLVALPG
jgi:hypothetical protein